MQLSLAASSLAIVGCGASSPIAIEDPAPPDILSTSSTSSGAVGGEVGLDADEGASADAEVTSVASATGGDVPGQSATLVPDGATWKVSTTAPRGWTAADFDDGAWLQHRVPIEADIDADGAALAQAPTMQLRHAFDVTAMPDGGVLELRVRRDDAAIAWLDGIELARSNIAGSGADDEVTGTDGYTYYYAVGDVSTLQVGTNVLAIEVRQRSDLDLSFDARLRIVDAPGSADAVQIQYRTTSYGGEYGPKHASVAWIETSAGDYVRTLGLWADERREHLVAWTQAGGLGMPDAITSATLGSHGSRLVEWALDDVAGEAVPAGDYVVRIELTEADSSAGAAAGPSIAIPVRVDGDARTIVPDETTAFRELLVLVPPNGAP